MKKETKLKKEQLKEAIKKQYTSYFDLLVAVGGALYLQDFSVLLNLDYTKTTRELKYIEENTNIIKSYTRVDCDPSKPPTSRKVICLTRAGWKYLTNKSRNEVKFENDTTMNNIRLKAYHYCNLRKLQEKNIDFKNAILKVYGNPKDDMALLFDGQEEIDINEFFKKTKFTLTYVSVKDKNNLSINATYISNRLNMKKFLEEMDLLLSILEYLYDRAKEDDDSKVKFNINVKCILRYKPDIPLFIHLKNKYERKYHYYFTTDTDIAFKHRRKFKTIFKEVYKRVDFYKLEDNYKLRKL